MQHSTVSYNGWSLCTKQRQRQQQLTMQGKVSIENVHKAKLVTKNKTVQTHKQAQHIHTVSLTIHFVNCDKNDLL